MDHVKLPAILAGLASGAVLAGCTNMEAMPKPESSAKPVACTMEYAPVCASKGNERRTFSNACMARADDYVVVSQGACDSK